MPCPKGIGQRPPSSINSGKRTEDARDPTSKFRLRGLSRLRSVNPSHHLFRPVPHTGTSSLSSLLPPHHTVLSTVQLLFLWSAVIVSFVFQSSTSTSSQPRLWCSRRTSTALNAHCPPFASLDWPASHINNPTAIDNSRLVVLPGGSHNAISVSRH